MGLIEELTDEQIRARIDALSVSPLSQAQDHFASLYQAEDEVKEAVAKKYRYAKPLTEAADSLIEYLQNADGRFMLGLREIDYMTRGFGPGELIYFCGYTASGKTQVFLTSVLNNRDKRVVLFTMDEPVELVLTKLVCMRTRSNAERLEERVKAGDHEAIERVRRLARQDFANLIVIDQSMTKAQMADAIKECEDFWQAPVDAIGLDYLELFARAEGVDVEQASQELKGWALGHPFPTMCIHQGSRGNAGKGQALGLNAMKYGGEQEAIVVLGVRRQRDNEDLDDFERHQHENTVDVSIIKNKRPPSKRGEHTYFMDPSSGLVLPLATAPQPTAQQEEF